MRKLLLPLLISFFLTACAPTSQPTVTITLPDGFNVQARVAITPEEHEQGLMFVKNLPENEGMIFVFDTPQNQLFWMKNTLIDLDIVFIGADKTVTSVDEQVPHSYTYTPDDQVARSAGYGQYVLELAAKTAAKHQVLPGQTLRFSLPEKL